MIKSNLNRAIAAAFTGLLALMPAAHALAETSPQNAVVVIGDAGFTPASASIPVGTTVTWINQGLNVHTATSTPTPLPPAPFDSGGLGPGQSSSVNFSRPGAYTYTSATDCLNGNITPGFACGTYRITVGLSEVASSSQPSPGLTVAQNATVVIGDAGFSPSSVAVTTGGVTSNPATVTFVNRGTTVHAAASGSVTTDDPSTPPDKFDTGGLAPGESATITFVNPETVVFSSATDCLSGNNNPIFDCAGPHTVAVMRSAPVGANAAAPALPFSGMTLYIKDATGFEQSSLTVLRGQTVTWMNVGRVAHSVVSDLGVPPPFDSGGLGTANIFSVTFQNPGTYHYHSSTEPIWSGDQIVGYQFTGTIVVQ